MSEDKSAADFWAKHMIETFENILRKSFPGGLPDDRKRALQENVRQWVFDVREDEIQAIIREITKMEAGASKAEITDLLRTRLPKRPL